MAADGSTLRIGAAYHRAPGRRRPLEPWYRIATAVLLPPLHLWFNWRHEGLERVPREGPIIVAGNHLSYVDPFAHGSFVVQAGRRPRFLAKQELFDNPFTRMVLLGAGQIPVQRGTGDRAPLQKASEALAAGEVVVVYPEGTTTTTNEDFSPGRGKTGVARLAVMTGVPVLPVATWGGQWVWRKGARKRITFGRPIWITAGEPMDLASRGVGLEDADGIRRLTDEVMAELAGLVEDLRARYPKRWS